MRKPQYVLALDAHAMDHIPGEDMPEVAKAAYAVSQEDIDAGVWVCGSGLEDMNRPGKSGDSVPWEGWSHVREYVEEVPGRAAGAGGPDGYRDPA